MSAIDPHLRATRAVNTAFSAVGLNPMDEDCWSRQRLTVRARALAFWILKNHTMFTVCDIARASGMKHNSIHHAVRDHIRRDPTEHPAGAKAVEQFNRAFRDRKESESLTPEELESLVSWLQKGGK